MSTQKMESSLKRKLTFDVTEVAKDDDKAGEKDVRGKSPKRRKRFIRVEEFNQLAHNPPMEWTVLKRDCIYKLCDIERVGERAVATLLDHCGWPYRVFIPLAILRMVYDKLASELPRDKAVEVYLRPQKDEEADIAIKETFPCQKGCNEEFHSKHGRWSHHKHCTEMGKRTKLPNVVVNQSADKKVGKGSVKRKVMVTPAKQVGDLTDGIDESKNH